MRLIVLVFLLGALPTLAFSEVRLRECKLTQRCILGKTCNEINEAFSWIEIDDNRLEVQYSDTFISTTINAKNDSVSWKHEGTNYGLQFLDHFQFFVTSFVVVGETDSASMTEEQKRDVEFRELTHPKAKEIASIAISYGRCD